MMKISSNQMRRGKRHGYRSGLEERIGNQLDSLKVKWEFEPDKIPYIGKPHTYTPDFKIGSIYIETKGRFLAKDRAKHLLVREQHPELDIRFVFTNPNQKLYKGAKTTYADWCIKHEFNYSRSRIPESWILEMCRD